VIKRRPARSRRIVVLVVVELGVRFECRDRHPVEREQQENEAGSGSRGSTGARAVPRIPRRRRGVARVRTQSSIASPAATCAAPARIAEQRRDTGTGSSRRDAAPSPSMPAAMPRWKATSP
jgi:hypothetical protein